MHAESLEALRVTRPEAMDLESVPEGAESVSVRWVQPTKCQGFTSVGCTHPTTVQPGFWNRLS